MNWDAIGALGELVGAAAVVATLIVLVVQVRHSTRAVQESNRLERAAALDRHSDSIGRWRGRLTEHADVARIWVVGRNDGELTEVEILRLNNLWIDFVNVQRANFMRANTVGDAGLARQAVLSIAVERSASRTFDAEWASSRPWHELASPEFVQRVEAESAEIAAGRETRFRAGGDHAVRK